MADRVVAVWQIELLLCGMALFSCSSRQTDSKMFVTVNAEYFT